MGVREFVYSGEVKLYDWTQGHEVTCDSCGGIIPAEDVEGCTVVRFTLYEGMHAKNYGQGIAYLHQGCELTMKRMRTLAMNG